MDSNEHKKKRIKIPKENKIRAELQKEIGSVCPFCDNKDVGHFEIHHIDENSSMNDVTNLILLCPTCHSKITKGDISLDEVIRKKIVFMDKTIPSNKITPTQNNVFNAPINKSIIGNNNKVTIKNYRKSPNSKYPNGCIGADINKANYIGHLITRYHEFQEYQIGKSNMNYAIFPSKLKSEFKIGKSRSIYHLSIERFKDIELFIQHRIDNTMLGKINNKKNRKNYSTFEEYLNLK